MIEAADYVLQFAAMTLCCIYAAIHFAREENRGWLMLTFFYACYAMGDLYWLLYVAFEGITPMVFWVSDLSWYTGFLFVCLLLRDIQEHRKPEKKRLAWLGPAFSAAACLFFLQWGDYPGNLITLAVMGTMGYLVLLGLLNERERGPFRRMYLSVVFFFLNEYAMWFSSCFWSGDSLLNPYFWFDGLMSVIAVWMAHSYRGVVKA
ncbi:MAG: hypothetical protein E7425_11405 [Ruminococcaceae bacterium]|nr:hypothetical protein [Oscillospiraceae bacterium]